MNKIRLQFSATVIALRLNFVRFSPDYSRNQNFVTISPFPASNLIPEASLLRRPNMNSPSASRLQVTDIWKHFTQKTTDDFTRSRKDENIKLDTWIDLVSFVDHNSPPVRTGTEFPSGRRPQAITLSNAITRVPSLADSFFGPKPVVPS